MTSPLCEWAEPDAPRDRRLDAISDAALLVALAGLEQKGLIERKTPPVFS